MNKKNEFEKWEKVRGKGKKHFILYYGVLRWGVPTGILFFILGEVFDHGLDISKYFTGDWIVSFVEGLISFSFGGILFGYVMWKT